MIATCGEGSLEAFLERLLQHGRLLHLQLERQRSAVWVFVKGSEGKLRFPCRIFQDHFVWTNSTLEDVASQRRLEMERWRVRCRARTDPESHRTLLWSGELLQLKCGFIFTPTWLQQRSCWTKRGNLSTWWEYGCREGGENKRENWCLWLVSVSVCNVSLRLMYRKVIWLAQKNTNDRSIRGEQTFKKRPLQMKMHLMWHKWIFCGSLRFEHCWKHLGTCNREQSSTCFLSF